MVFYCKLARKIHIGPTCSIKLGLCGPSAYRQSLQQEAAFFVDFRSISEDFPVLRHVGDHIPVDGRLILAARLQIRLTDGHVHRPTDLLIKKDILRKLLNAVVGTDGGLSKTARSGDRKHPVEHALALRDKGVIFETVTLHVGLDTFKPVEAERVEAHTIHSEWASLTAESAKRINEAKLAGGRLIAVGTTTMRTLETGALRSAGLSGSLQDISARDASGETSNFCPWKPVAAFTAPTDLFIYPGYKFRAVDALITNFHLPHSSLLMLVAAFANREFMLRAYETAVAEQYRFFSFGDAMLIL